MLHTTVIVVRIRQTIYRAEFLLHFGLLVNLKHHCLVCMTSWTVLNRLLKMNKHDKILNKFTSFTWCLRTSERIAHLIEHHNLMHGPPVFSRQRLELATLMHSFFNCSMPHLQKFYNILPLFYPQRFIHIVHMIRHSTGRRYHPTCQQQLCVTAAHCSIKLTEHLGVLWRLPTSRQCHKAGQIFDSEHRRRNSETIII
ncbi:hypothetical protein T4C_5026 [Trichinella pseudospiralis]|uniref:Uncharacterized protein n=3 Tax=Trichinella pseudospiralis TaxID=6337 RepID=A0A0V1IJN8_TRIPS|nr:hypothetical protein T4C_5026 [Trichinella pseudospiralis]